MKKLLLFASLMFIICSCADKNTAKIDVTVNGADTTDIVLQKLNFKVLQPVDTIKTDASGRFVYNVAMVNESPAFYYLYCKGQKIASLILLPGDKVTVEADLKGNYTVSGSEESLKFQDMEAEFNKVKTEMGNVAVKANEYSTDEEIKAINAQLSKMYIDYKRALTKRMITDSTSLTSAVAAFYKINDNLPIFNELTDAILFKTVYNNLSKVYPHSEYLQALLDEATKRQNSMEMNYRIEQVEEIGYPDINMPDINGEMRSLKDLQGKVVMLMFWSASLDDQKLMNHDLLEMYNKYHEQGFEIYQVALDIDKAYWASVIKSQQIPWVAVNDGLGVDSPSLMMYNIQSIPTAFVISRDGEIFVKNLNTLPDFEAQIKKLL